jgi:nicotinate phosphoribosyltransferase
MQKKSPEIIKDGHSHLSLYRPSSLTMLTDLYQLTMAYGYWHSGTHDKEAVFYMSFRHNPFRGGFAVACGLTYLIDYIRTFHFEQSDIEYLASLTGEDHGPIFDKQFLEYLSKLEFSCDIHCVPEGTVVFAHEPIVRVSGPIIQCQLLETLLLNIMNFQTLIATKAARVAIAATDRPIIEFGLRRAQGTDGALAASWAAYVGGCTATSNVLAGKIFGIPVKGTHAHSWVMSFSSELEAFGAYAEAMPNNCIFLVDTYDTLGGVKNAIEIGRKLKANGHKLGGVRLDSGDLAYLSIESRKLLDQSGFNDAVIVVSNDLDEHVMQSLNDQNAQIDVWGVGTKLATAYDQPALGGVYKLSAIRKPGEKWQPKIKLSEQAIKISNPGVLQTRRFISKKTDGLYAGDMVFNEDNRPSGILQVIVDPMDFTRRKEFAANAAFVDLLVPIFIGGKQVYSIPPASEIKQGLRDQLAKFHPTIKRLLNPHEYPVGLEQGLHKLKTQLILEARKAQSKRMDTETDTGQWSTGQW